MQKQTQSNNLRTCVLSRINGENVCPRSRLFFHSRECFVWFFWFISVVVGALAVAVMEFVVMYRQYDFHEATHESFWWFVVDMLPFLWLAVFAGMALFAVFNLRHTKRGYRWPLWVILASSLGFSLLGGSLLQAFGFGYELDERLGHYMPLYKSQNMVEEQLWQDPADGRLIGMQIYSTDAPTSTIIFEDIGGTRWRMDVSELSLVDFDTLASEQKVRVLGQIQDETVPIFHACGAFPWMFKSDMRLAEMSEKREQFLERVYQHAVKEQERLALLEAETFAVEHTIPESVCAKMAVVERMPKDNRAVGY